VHPKTVEVQRFESQLAHVSLDVDEVYRRYGPMVLRRCRHMLIDEGRARDAMHDVFVQLLSHRERLSAQAPSSLLWQVATRICLNRIRSARRSRETGQREDALLGALAELPDESERTGARALLQRLFRGEQPSTRVIAVLHYVDGMTLEETAAEVGLSVSGVRKRLRTLRARLGALAPEEERP
jgi:RNA polymerase sigma-70 factor (ECF subfamily)